MEQAFFQYWFEHQNVTTQNIVKGLVANGQLTFLNGGWSMHDEANPTYIDMIDNTATGQRAILGNFGQSALPTVTWQIGAEGRAGGQARTHRAPCHNATTHMPRASLPADPFGHSAFQGVLSSSLSGYKGCVRSVAPQARRAAPRAAAPAAALERARHLSYPQQWQPNPRRR